MIENLNEKLIKEYEMLISESMKEIERGQAIIVEDCEYAKSLVDLFKNLLIEVTKYNSTEGEKAICQYLDRIEMAPKYQNNNDNLNKIKNNIIQKLNQKIKKNNELIEKYINFKSFYMQKLKNVSRLEESWVEINNKIDNLTNEELNTFKDFINSVSKEINEEINKKSMLKSLLAAAGVGLASVTGAFLYKKIPTEKKEAILNFGKDIVKTLSDYNKIDENKDNPSNALECVNNISSVTRNM